MERDPVDIFEEFVRKIEQGTNNLKGNGQVKRMTFCG